MRYLISLLALAIVACGSDPSTPEPEPVTIVIPEPVIPEPVIPEPELIVPEPVTIFTPEPVTPEPQLVQLVYPQITTTSLLTEEYRGQFTPLPWTVAQMDISFEPLTDHTYQLVYEGELVPGQISSPWRFISDFPTSLRTFDRSTLPTLQVRVCTQETCLTGEPLAWGEA